jgi:putative membrane protein
VDDRSKGASGLGASTDLGIDRTRLAYERTLLSWVRTATSLITFGFAIQQFFRIARAGAPEAGGVIIGPHAFGLTMITIGLLALVLATIEHWRNILALHQRYPEKRSYRSNASILAACIGLLGILGFVSMLFHE